jgi:hypothetical protein
MKILVAYLALPLAVAGVDALAQADPMERLRACSMFSPAERLECLNKLSHDIGPPPANPISAPAAEVLPTADNWIVSQTTSPFDYSPIAIATASTSSGPDGAALQLSIQCRGGGTELVLASASLRGEGYTVTYCIDDGGPVQVATGTPASRTGLAIKGDVVRLLAALPDHGTISFRIAAQQGASIEGRYALASLNAVLKRLAGPCKWPVVAQPGK